MAAFLDADALYNLVVDIFAVTVLLDQKERDRELIEFTHAAMVHNHTLRPNVILSRKKILDGFAARKAVLLRNLADDSDDSFKRGLLNQIQDPSLQRKVLSSIFTIAVCDYELHDEESAFIRSALQIWKAELPSLAEIEMVS